MNVLHAAAQPSPARVDAPALRSVRVAAVQQSWQADPVAHQAALAEGIRLAAAEGAELVCLQELTLSAYFAVTPDGPGPDWVEPEPLHSGPTMRFAAEMAEETNMLVHASLYEERPGHRLGYNTAIVVGPDRSLRLRTRKLHIPVTAGYYEDKYFAPGPAESEAFETLHIGSAEFGFPTCWDQWFPELARVYSLRGAAVLVYPTAIGSEPDHPGFDTEPPITFYGSSFISDPYGRILVQAPRDEPAVLVADLDIDQRRDWLTLFPFLTTRRPDAYDALTDRGGA